MVSRSIVDSLTHFCVTFGICFTEEDRGDSVSQQQLGKTCNDGRNFCQSSLRSQQFNYQDPNSTSRQMQVARRVSVEYGSKRTKNSICLQQRLNRRHRPKHIKWKILFVVLYTFASWAENWEESRVIVFCDTEAVVAGINKRTIRGAAIRPLQSLFLLAAQRNIDVVAVWVPSKANALADALSRFDLDKITITHLVGQQASSPLRRQPSMIMSKACRLMQPSTCTTVLCHPPGLKTSLQ